MIYML